MVERPFDAEKLYNKVVHFYIDKRRYDTEQANRIAQIVVTRAIRRRTCKTCRHMMHHHLSDKGTCLYVDCRCDKFIKWEHKRKSSS